MEVIIFRNTSVEGKSVKGDATKIHDEYPDKVVMQLLAAGKGRLPTESDKKNHKRIPAKGRAFRNSKTMTAVTSSDVARMIAGHDLACSITLANECEIKGIFKYDFAESLDFNSRQPSVTVANGDIGSVTVGQAIIVEDTSFTVRAIERGQYTSRMFLEKP